MSDLADKFDIEKEPNGEHEKDTNEIEGPDTNPQHNNQFELLRAAYVEHGKKIGSLEERMEAMHLNLLGEMDQLKTLVINLTKALREENDEPTIP